MHDEIAIIHEDPFGGLIAFHVGRQLSDLFQTFADLVRDGVPLARVRNRADDEVIGKRRYFAKVEDRKIGGFLGFNCPGGGQPVGKRLNTGGFPGSRAGDQKLRKFLLQLAYYTEDACVNAQNGVVVEPRPTASNRPVRSFYCPHFVRLLRNGGGTIWRCR